MTKTDIEQIKADREAADIILKRAGVFSTSVYAELAEAFARHRIAAQRPLLEALEVFITKDLSRITVGDLRKAESAIKQARGD